MPVIMARSFRAIALGLGTEKSPFRVRQVLNLNVAVENFGAFSLEQYSAPSQRNRMIGVVGIRTAHIGTTVDDFAVDEIDRAVTVDDHVHRIPAGMFHVAASADASDVPFGAFGRLRDDHTAV